MFGIVYLPPHGHTSYFACYQVFFFSFRHIKHISSGKSLKLLFFLSYIACIFFAVGVNTYNGFCVNGPSVDKTGEVVGWTQGLCRVLQQLAFVWLAPVLSQLVHVWDILYSAACQNVNFLSGLQIPTVTVMCGLNSFKRFEQIVGVYLCRRYT